MRRSWSLPTVAFLIDPLCNPWLLTQPPRQQLGFSSSLACDSIVDQRSPPCSYWRDRLARRLPLHTACRAVRRIRIGRHYVSDRHFTCGRNKIAGRSHEGDETGLQRLNDPRPAGMLSVKGNEVAGRQLSATSTQNRGHGHLEIVTCDSQSLAGAFATVAIEDRPGW